MFTTSLFFPAQSEVPELPIHHALAKAGQLLIQLMSSESIEKVQAWVDRLLTLYPEAKVIGLSAEPMIHDGQLYHDGTLLIFSHFANTQLTCSAQALSHSG
ncbi:MAG: sensor domain-containing phosphodiesterase, partial [Vibrio metschnikovii]